MTLKRLHRTAQIIPDSTTRGDEPLEIIIKTEPVAKARSRVRLVQGKPYSYNPHKTQEAQDFLYECFLPYRDKVFGSYVPVKLTIIFYRTNKMKYKRGLARKERLPVRKPDCDNMLKLALDSMNGVLVADDSQIVEIHSSKLWSDKDYPYISIKLEEVKPCHEPLL